MTVISIQVLLGITSKSIVFELDHYSDLILHILYVKEFYPHFNKVTSLKCIFCCCKSRTCNFIY